MSNKSEPANTESASANTELANTELSSAYSDLNIGNDNNGPGPEDNKPFKHKYTKVFIKDPYNNRDTIHRLTKKQKGVYVWSSFDNKNVYVGRSINLSARICTYFLPSILKSKARRVLSYLNKYGFNEINLTVYILDINTKLEDVVALEQHFFDILKPNLNLTLIANVTGYQPPMVEEMKEKMRKLKGTPIYVYEAETLCLLFIFESKTYMIDTINIHHNTLKDCLDSGDLYLEYFFLSIESLESENIKLLALDDMKALVRSKWDAYKNRYHPAARAVQAIHKDDKRKNFQCDSLGSLAERIKGDRTTIRGYLKGERPGMYYRGKWQFTYV